MHEKVNALVADQADFIRKCVLEEAIRQTAAKLVARELDSMNDVAVDFESLQALIRRVANELDTALQA